MTLLRFGKKENSGIDLDYYSPPMNGFEINFDPYLLKYSTLPITKH
jgi:hypothetical protein